MQAKTDSNAKSQDTKLSRPHRHTPPHDSFDYHPPSNTAASHLLSTPFPAAEPPYHHNPLVVCIQSGNKNQRLDGGPPMHVMCRLSPISSLVNATQLTRSSLLLERTGRPGRGPWRQSGGCPESVHLDGAVAHPSPSAPIPSSKRRGLRKWFPLLSRGVELPPK